MVRNDDGRIVAAEPTIVDDLDSLSMPTYDLLPLDGPYSPSTAQKAISFISSRGCPYNCAYCSKPICRKAKVYQTAKLFELLPNGPNESWQMDVTYVHIPGFGWRYVITVTDYYSRHLLAAYLTDSYSAAEAIRALSIAQEEAERQCGPLTKRPFLVTDNGPSFVAHRFGAYLKGAFQHVRIQYRTPTQLGLAEPLIAPGPRALPAIWQGFLQVRLGQAARETAENMAGIPMFCHVLHERDWGSPYGPGRPDFMSKINCGPILLSHRLPSGVGGSPGTILCR